VTRGVEPTDEREIDCLSLW